MIDPIEQIARTVKTMEATIAELQSQGVEPVYLVAALGECCGRVAKTDKQGAVILNNLVGILRTYAQTIRDSTAFKKAESLVDEDQQRCKDKGKGLMQMLTRTSNPSINNLFDIIAYVMTDVGFKYSGAEISDTENIAA